MAKISTYTSDGTIEAADKLIGTDGSSGVDSGKTKNYSVAALTTYIASNLANPVKISGVVDAADDTAAASAGVPVNGIYRTGNALKIRVS